MSARFARVSPVGTGSGAGALAIIQLEAASGDELDSALRRIGLADLPLGAVQLRYLLGIDRGLAARFAPTMAQFLVHGSPLVTAELTAAIQRAGWVPADRELDSPSARFPEARDLVEACMLDALARAPSPMAVDVLLSQPNVWRRKEGRVVRGEDKRSLDRLLTPPLVVAIGPPNVGKSSLLNALAGREVSVVADQPGTTRDHVGVLLDLDGLVVRWVDVPGSDDCCVRASFIDRTAIQAAREVIRAADMVIACADARTSFTTPAVYGVESPLPVLRCGTRADLGPVSGAEMETSSLDGRGITALARLVRDRLVPPRLLSDPVRWPFHALLHEDSTLG